MRAIFGMMLLCSATVLAVGQSSPKYQAATITAVKQHESTVESSAYEVSLKVKNTVYVVLYTPPDGTDTITHRAGIDLLVSVKPKTIAFNNLLGRKMEVPILSRKPTSPST